MRSNAIGKETEDEKKYKDPAAYAGSTFPADGLVPALQDSAG